jgi:lysophospholipase L1-like esterase
MAQWLYEARRYSIAAGLTAAIAVLLGLLYCSDDLTAVRRPITISVTADSAVAIYDTLKIKVFVPETGVWGIRYIWFIDSPSPADTTTDSVLKKVFTVIDTGRHRIVIKAFDRSGQESPEHSLYVNVTCSHPHLVPLPDTSVKVNDTLVLHFSGYDSVSRIAGYRYYFDNPNTSRFVTGPTLVTFWRVADSGRHVLVVTAQNQDSVQSLSDTSIVTVTYYRPKVRLHADSVVKINDTLKLEAQASDSDGSIDHYLWSIDGAGTAWFSTQKDSLRWVFGGVSESFHTIRAAAVDNDGLVSYADSVRVHVRLERPVVRLLPKDTTIYADRDLKLKAMASDTNGVIVAYRWMLDGRLLTQSLHCDTVTLRWGAGQAGTHLVAVTVVDNDSLESPQDSVLVTVLPDTIIVIVSALNDTIILSEKSVGDTVAFAFNAPSPDGDTIVYSLWWRSESAATDSLVYQDTGRSARVDGTGPGRYFWRLEARDSRGHTRVTNGNVVVIREHRICFIGHSIVDGYGGDGIVGGFRGGVLDSLRKTFGPYERLKAVGPATTDYMSRSASDDSCMAIMDTRAKDLCNMMTAFPSLTADIWVLMIGVNDGYNPQEQTFTTALIDVMYMRNPTGRIYVLNGEPLSSYWVPSFNQNLTDAIAARVAGGCSVFQVDANAALTDSSGYYNDPTLFYDGVHPNQKGYDRLRDTIFSTMENSIPPVIPKNP